VTTAKEGPRSLSDSAAKTSSENHAEPVVDSPVVLPDLDTVAAPRVELTGESDWPRGFSERHRDYLTKRGATPGVVAAADVRSFDLDPSLPGPQARKCLGQSVTRWLDQNANATRLDGGAMKALRGTAGDDDDGGVDSHGGGIGFPLTHVDGTTAAPQVRLDSPAPAKDGKARKFVGPKSASLADAHLTLAVDTAPWWVSAEWLDDPRVPVVVTEGPTRALAIVAAAAREGVAVIPAILPGVWQGVETQRTSGGTTIGRALHPDLARLVIPRRTFLLAFDADVIGKRPVRDALEATAYCLEGAGAEPALVAVPPLVNDDAKTGLDDALGAGHTLVDIVASAGPLADLPPIEEPAKEDADDGRDSPTDPYAIYPADPVRRTPRPGSRCSTWAPGLVLGSRCSQRPGHHGALGRAHTSDALTPLQPAPDHHGNDDGIGKDQCWRAPRRTRSRR
jgi:hypothetical protein